MGVCIAFIVNHTRVGATAPFIIAGAAGIGGGAIPAPVITMTPAKVSRDPIDYSVKARSALYDHAIKSLHVDSKNVYDLCQTTNLGWSWSGNRQC